MELLDQVLFALKHYVGLFFLILIVIVIIVQLVLIPMLNDSGNELGQWLRSIDPISWIRTVDPTN